MSCLAAMVFPLTAAIISAEMPSARVRHDRACCKCCQVSLPRSFAEAWRASAVETSPLPGESTRRRFPSPEVWMQLLLCLHRYSALLLLLFASLCGVEKRRPLPLVLHAQRE